VKRIDGAELAMRKLTIGSLELSTIDRNDADTEYIYNEVFNSCIYHFDRMRLPPDPTIMDVGANIGIYSLWAHHRYRPRAIYCYEASPRTFACLQDNIDRLIRPQTTEVRAVNRAIAARSGETLVLNQSSRVSGISTLLARSQVSWVDRAAADRELEHHEVVTSTISDEIAAHRLATVDILKIDVEGYFIEALKGIAAADVAKIRNMVIEVDYLPETGIRPDDVEALLRSMGYATDCLDRSMSNNLTFYAWRA
jgi:FkbM family methyltransferase